MTPARLLYLSAILIIGVYVAERPQAMPLLLLPIATAPLLRQRFRVITVLTLAVGLLDGLLRGVPVYTGEDLPFRSTCLVTDVRGAGPTSLTLLCHDGKRYSLQIWQAPIPKLGSMLGVHGRIVAFDPVRNDGGIDFRSYAAERAFWATIENPRFTTLARTSQALCGPCDNAEPAFSRLRRWADNKFALVLSPINRAMLMGAVLGDRGEMPDDILSDFRTTGTLHVLVTAGLHVGVFTAIVLLALRRMGGGRVSASAACIVIVWIYAGLCGMHLPVFRAAIAASLILTGRMLGSVTSGSASILLAADVIVLVEPSAVYSESFALSFIAVASLAVLREPLRQAIERALTFGNVVSGRAIYSRQRMSSARSWMIEALASILSIEIGLAPMDAVVFHQVPIAGVVANFFVIPMMSLAMLEGTVYLTLMAMRDAIIYVVGKTGFMDLTLVPEPPWLRAFIASVTWTRDVGNVVNICFSGIMESTLQAMIAVVHILGNVPYAALAISITPTAAVIIYSVACIAAAAHSGVWIGLMRFTDHRASAAKSVRAHALLFHRITPIIVLFFVAVISISLSDRSDQELRITMLDVGQGDGIVIETPVHHVFVIDAGGRLERSTQATNSSAETAAAKIILPFFAAHRITHVDAIILTHPHGDHAGGVAPILSHFSVDRFFDSGQAYRGHAYRDALRIAAQRHVPVINVTPGMKVATDDGVSIEMLGPTRPLFSDGADDVNNNSIIAMVGFQGMRMMFTGDAGAPAERRLLASGIDLRADILKVGHHGSAYATTAAFVAAVRPRLALISVGRKNTFGHPAARTIKTLERFGAKVFRTDRCGAITIKTAGKSLEISTLLKC